jgi:hypothetical protein
VELANGMRFNLKFKKSNITLRIGDLVRDEEITVLTEPHPITDITCPEVGSETKR